MGQNFGLMNIIREVPIDLSSGDFTDENGFFLRSDAGATISYCPKNNLDSEAISKTLPASEKFDDPVICRKVFATGSPLPDDLYAGYGV